MITKIVPISELGKVFSVIDFFKSILAISAPIICGKLYEHTVRTVPNAFIYFRMSGTCLVFIIVLIVYIVSVRHERRTDQTFALSEEEKNNKGIELKSEMD